MKIPTPIRSALFAVTAAVALSFSAHAVCTIDMVADQQVIDGFGFSTAWCGQLSDAKNNSLYDTLGMSLLRVQIDANSNWGAETANAGAAHARGLKVLGTPWSPPAYMKDNNSVVHGRLLASQYGNYASYLNQAANSIGLDYVSIQNEPDYDAEWDSCLWSGEELHTFCLNNAQAIGRPVVMPESLRFDNSYSDPTLNDPAAASNVSIVAGHLYGGAIPSVHQNALNKGKRVWQTEHYLDNTAADMGNCINFAKEVSDCMNCQYSAYFWWWVADSGSNLVESSGKIFKNGYMFGQFAKWIRPNSTRVTADYNPSPGVYVTAYRVNGGTVIVAVNTGSSPITQQFCIFNGNAATLEGYRTSASENMADIGSFFVRSGGFAATLPAQSVTTFVQNSSLGVVFYQDPNYGGTASPLMAAGSYTQSQLAALGVPGDWASSVKVPDGWSVTLYAGDNFSGTQWTLNSDTAALGSLDPSADEQMSSCIIRPASAELTGTIIGTAGSWNNGGNTIAKVFDSNTSSYFDGPVANGCWAGLDFGVGASNAISAIKYCPRSTKPDRMVGGVFQGANQADFSDAVTLATITSQPATGVYTSAEVAGTAAFRYVRYLSPDGSYGNVAEVKFFYYTPQVVPPLAPDLTGLSDNQQVELSWTAPSGAVSYEVKRATASGGPYTAIGNPTATSFTDSNVVNGTPYYYVVSAVNDGGESANSSEEAVTPAPNDIVTLTGTVIGTPGSWGGLGNTIDHVFDNDLATYFDGPSANGCWAGLDFGVGAGNVVTQINYCPRAINPDRMVGGIFQGANQADFSDAVTLATIGTQPPTGAPTSVIVTNTTAFRFVRYLSPDNSFGNVAELQFIGYLSSPATVALQGSIIGTPGSWGNLGNTISKVFDNNTDSYFDGPAANGCWAGLDFGPGARYTITRLKYCPRSYYPQRMVGGVFQGANQADFSDAVTLFTIVDQPPTGVYTRVRVSNTATFRYVRYLSPDGGWGNVAELEFYGYPFSLPVPPTGLAATAVSSSQINLAWTAVSGAASYNVKRSSTSGTGYTTVVSGVTATSYSDTGLANGTTYHYVVSAVNADGEGGDSAEASATPSAPITDEELKCPSIRLSGGNLNVVKERSVAGHQYQIEISPDLTTGSWQAFGDPQPGTGGDLLFLMPLDPEIGRRFCRVRVQR